MLSNEALKALQQINDTVWSIAYYEKLANICLDLIADLDRAINILGTQRRDISVFQLDAYDNILDSYNKLHNLVSQYLEGLRAELKKLNLIEIKTDLSYLLDYIINQEANNEHRRTN